MKIVAQTERVANYEQVNARRRELSRLLRAHGLTDPRLRNDGAIVVTASSYRGLAEAAVPAEELLGAHVRLIIDTAPDALTDALTPL